VEQSFSFRRLTYYGAKDSIRTDDILRDRFGKPLAIYDLKTGGARLTGARVKELRDGVGKSDIPVIELHFNDGTAILR
jgi:hypothetical protein